MITKSELDERKASLLTSLEKAKATHATATEAHLKKELELVELALIGFMYYGGVR
mgnify:CR=1 FL=1